MAEFRIPYEHASAPRSELRRIYGQALAAGSILPPAADGEHFQKIFWTFGGDTDPKMGWAELSIELRLVELSLHGWASANTVGRSQIRATGRKLSKKLQSVHHEMASLVNSPDYIDGLLNLDIADSNWVNVNRLATLGDQLDRIATHLANTKQKSKWRESQNRKLREELAVRLRPLFEAQFDQPARPLGGSERRKVEETNDWSRFFQMAAKAFWGEAESPDRQAILTKANLPPAW